MFAEFVTRMQRIAFYDSCLINLKQYSCERSRCVSASYISAQHESRKPRRTCAQLYLYVYICLAQEKHCIDFFGKSNSAQRGFQEEIGRGNNTVVLINMNIASK